MQVEESSSIHSNLSVDSLRPPMTRSRSNSNNPKFAAIRAKLGSTTAASTNSKTSVGSGSSLGTPIRIDSNAGEDVDHIQQLDQESTESTAVWGQVSSISTSATDKEENEDLWRLLADCPPFRERPDLLSLFRRGRKGKDLVCFIHHDPTDPGTERHILKEGDLFGSLYFVLEGACFCTQQVLYFEDDGGKQIPVPPGHIPKEGESTEKRSMEVGEVEVNEWFPYFANLISSTSKEDLTLQLANATLDCSIKVKAGTKAVLAKVDMFDFIDLVSMPVIHSLNESKVFRFDQAFLQQELFEQHKFDRKSNPLWEHWNQVNSLERLEIDD